LATVSLQDRILWRTFGSIVSLQLKTILPVTTTQYNIFDWPCYCLIVDDMEKELKHNIYSQLSKFYLTLFSVLEHKFLLVNLVADISMFLYLQFFASTPETSNPVDPN